MSQDITSFTLAEARAAIDRGEVSAQELVSAHIARASQYKHLNCFITETYEQACAAAEKADAVTDPDQRGILHGLPIANKDLFCTKGVRTTAGSKILDNYVPVYESTVTHNLAASGAISLGKLNLDEFAMGSANITSYYGPVVNPWHGSGSLRDKKFVPGGSSGGSSAAVAANLCLAATGTDTGGSIRQPAAFTGTVGLKPTYGTCSRYGIVAFASSLDQAGPITKTVEDAALMLEAMASYDPKDATSLPQERPLNLRAALNKDVKGMRIGIPKEYRLDTLSQEIVQMWESAARHYQDAGAEIVDISLPHTQYALPAYYIIAPAEASSNLARYDGVRYGYRCQHPEDLLDLYQRTRSQGFGTEVKRRIMIGTYVLSAGYYDAYYLKAQKMRRLIVEDFKSAFEQVDVLLAPTTPSPAFAIGEEPTDPVHMYQNDVLTVPANIAGLPALSLPVTCTPAGLPLGMQIIAPARQEARLIEAGHHLEQAVDFRAKYRPEASAAKS